MTYTIVCYKDKQLDTFMPPMFIPQDVHTIIEGCRNATIKGKVEDAASKVLYLIGTFETENAKITTLENPEKLLDLETLVSKDA